MKKIITLTALFLVTLNAFSQAERIPIFTYGSDTVYSDEFMRVFNKNNRDGKAATKAEIEEYLDLYVKFKLKVKEAYARQMDTVPAFITELAGYREQLTRPYLTDKAVNDMLVEQAYERSLIEVNASHLLILCDKNAKPADTLAAYQRIMGIRDRIVKGNQDFEKLAAQLSQDPSAPYNRGNLGYFTVFQMIYSFEDAAYKLDVGEVSMPIRTVHGYHLVKLNDKRSSLPNIQVGQISVKFVAENQADSAKRRIDAVYQLLQNGGQWKTVVEEFSEDFTTSSNEGKLNYFNRSSNRIPTQFKDEAYGLKVGQYSKPFRTRNSWHIIKLFDRQGHKNFEEMKSSIKRKVEMDTRSELNKTVVLERIKKENNYKLLVNMPRLYAHFDSSLMQGKWRYDHRQAPDESLKVLFTIADQAYTLEQFEHFVHKQQAAGATSVESAVNRLFDAYVSQSNFDYEKAHLEQKYDDFRYIMQEYKDGILLFELTDREVWSKAINDSDGLNAFYEANQQNYMWGERAEVTVYSFKDARTAKKGMKLARKMSGEELMTKMNQDDALSVNADTRFLEKAQFNKMEGVEWKVGVYEQGEVNDRIRFVKVHRILPPEIKPLNKNLGTVTSDYQNALEAQWIADLKKKYPVMVFEENVANLY